MIETKWRSSVVGEQDTEQDTVQYRGPGTGAPHTAGTADPELEQEQSTVQYSTVQHRTAQGSSV